MKVVCLYCNHFKLRCKLFYRLLLTSRDLALNSETHIINGTIKLSNTTEFLTDIMNLSQTESSMQV